MNLPNKVHGVSFPRSGHKYVTDLLQSYFGPEFRYAGHNPSVSGQWCEGANYSKDHDRDDLTPILSDRNYLVQIRDPFDSFYSWHRMDAGHPDFVDTREDFCNLMSQRLDYWTRFVRKWVLSEIPNRMILHYQDLLDDTRGSLSRMVILFGETPDEERINAACRAVPRIARRQPRHFLQSWV